MNEHASNNQRYEYHLSFLQVFCNPPGLFVYRCSALMLLFFLLYGHAYKLDIPDVAVFWIIEAFMLVTSMQHLFWGARRWKRKSNKRWIEFTDTGVASNYYYREESSKTATKLNTIPYSYLLLRDGLCGTFLIYSPAHAGEYVLIPSNLLSREELETRLQFA